MSTNNVENSSLGEKISRISGKRLRAAREKADFSQDEVAQILGKRTRSTISKWERGKANPSFVELAILSVIYKADPAYLIGVDFVVENSTKNLDSYSKEARKAEKSVIEVETHVNELIKDKLPPGVTLEELQYYLGQLQFFLKGFEDSDGSN